MGVTDPARWPPHQKPPWQCQDKDKHWWRLAPLHQVTFLLKVQLRALLFQAREVFQSMVEAHWTADPGSGERVSNQYTLIQTQPIQQDPPFAKCMFHIHYILYTFYCCWVTMSLKLLVPNFFHCLGDEERSEQAKLWVGGFPPFFCVGPNAFSGMDRSPRRHSENVTAFFQGGFLPRRISKLLGQSWWQQQHCLTWHFYFLGSHIPDQIGCCQNSLNNSSS